jgi:3-oxocholest-4-en-26-oyl-CoA dehydrogenase beta subunit
MDFALNEQQIMLQKSARDFLVTEYPEKLLRQMSADPCGYTPELWSKVTELGWTCLAIPEEFGGMGDFLDLAVVLQEMGRACFISPYFATLVLGASVILKAGNENQKKTFLPDIAAGKTLVTLALLEKSARYAAEDIRMQASADQYDFLISGAKLFVPHAQSADYLILAARTRRTSVPQEGITLFLVDRRTPGVTCELLPTFDGDKLCQVHFENVRLSHEWVLGEPDQGWSYLQQVMAEAAVGRCLETLGACDRVMEMTMSYAKERTAFGHPIGSFQSIQHRSADMLMDLEGSRFITYKAAWLISTGLPYLKESSMAKAWVNQAAGRIINSAHQIHGAIGFTADHVLHLYTKRIRSNEFSFGDTEHQLNNVVSSVMPHQRD